MKKQIGFVAICLCCAAPAFAQAGAASLETAKSLYLSASYQDALAMLDKVKGDVPIEEAAKYRALCLLGLNRTQEAQQAIERLLAERPLYALDPLDSPKLQTIFRDARARVLPDAAKDLYATARATFDRGDLTKAVDEFHAVVKLMSEPEVAADPALADLKVLAAGFARLAEQQLAAERKVARPGTAQPPVDSLNPALWRAAIYSERDADVVPPVAIAQEVPQWLPPNVAGGSATFFGTMEVVIDEQGNVTSAVITRPTVASYDQLLLAAARKWRYRPASYGGHTVKYRKLVRVTLQPQSAASRDDSQGLQ